MKKKAGGARARAYLTDFVLKFAPKWPKKAKIDFSKKYFFVCPQNASMYLK